jgi:hypothetical protein
LPDEWRVHTSKQVLDRWAQRASYSQQRLVAYWDWVVARTLHGPPVDTIRPFGEEELLLADIPGTPLVVAFFVSVQDRMIIVKEIT